MSACRRLLSIVSLLLLPAPLLTQQAPGPAKEVDALKRMVGRWTNEGRMEDNPWTKGGPFRGTETCELFPGGHQVVCRNQGSGPLGNTQGLTVYYWDSAASTYRIFALDNTGYANLASFSATADGFTWNVEEPSPNGPVRTRGTASFAKDNSSSSFKMEMLRDGKWVAMSQGTGKRAP